MSTSPDAPGIAPPTVGALTRLVWLSFRERMYALVREGGFDDLQPAHVLLVRYPTIDGLRPGALADQMGISKQAMNDLMRHMESRGYLTLEPDPSDGRARLIRLTDRGHALMEFCRDAAQTTSDEWAAVVGPRRLGALHKTLTRLLEVGAEAAAASTETPR